MLPLVLQLFDHQGRQHLIDLLVRSFVRRNAALQLKSVYEFLF